MRNTFVSTLVGLMTALVGLIAIASPAGAADADLAYSLDQIVNADSQSWVFNRYDRGSMRNVAILNRSSGSILVYGEYTYNRGRPGWVKARISGNQLECLEFWDFAGNCRPFGRSPSQQIAGGVLAFLVVGGLSGGGGGSTGGSGNSCDDACQFYNYQRQQNSVARQLGQPEPNPGVQ